MTQSKCPSGESRNRDWRPGLSWAIRLLQHCVVATGLLACAPAERSISGRSRSSVDLLSLELSDEASLPEIVHGGFRAYNFTGTNVGSRALYSFTTTRGAFTVHLECVERDAGSITIRHSTESSGSAAMPTESYIFVVSLIDGSSDCYLESSDGLRPVIVRPMEAGRMGAIGSVIGVEASDVPGIDQLWHLRVVYKGRSPEDSRVFLDDIWVAENLPFSVKLDLAQSLASVDWRGQMVPIGTIVRRIRNTAAGQDEVRLVEWK